ncbi:MAG: DUF4290 domain-containing protein [Bacteroidota bacterium]
MNHEYNSQREQLIIPEYGRNIQKLVNYAKTIKDRDKRTSFAHSIVKIMSTINQNFRDRSDFNQKLWDHLAIISNFELEIDSPYETPTKEILNEKPKPIPYCKNRIKYKHFGHIIENMIEKAVEIEDKKEQEKMTELIANHMKRLYLLWNKERAVDDDQILETLQEMSKNRLKVNKDMQLIDVRELQQASKSKKTPKNFRKIKY